MSQFKKRPGQAGAGPDAYSVNGKSLNGKANPVALARAVSLHLEGKRAEALSEVNRLIESGDATAEVYAAKAHIQFELEQYEAAAASYEKLLAVSPADAASNFNLALCLEKLGRW